ncbi:WYL domain-containing protein [Nocardioides sp.]|uniref:helix-turn-helix transcriptional regulator n=1 Tax=Nocardioides sp. TaxID=35761 RepID=UPI00260BBD4B|nr:WYL domain-containing protein [Nocardioides sp.]
MKASRLLAMLLLLQARERMTSAELAERLEVSRRTVLRDVEALSAAGVPVYAERGRHGAIVLLEGARLNASHLDPAELEALRLTGLDVDALASLDLLTTARSAQRKLSARAPAVPGSSARLADVILVEHEGWRAASATSSTAATVTTPTPVTVAEVATAVLGDQRLRLAYRRSGEATATPVLVDPYGLVQKAGRWYLVADVEERPRLFAVSRISAVHTLAETARRRPRQSLASVWADLREQTSAPGEVVVTARLRTSRIDLAQRILGTRLSVRGPEDDGWSPVAVTYDDPEGVRQLLQFADHLEVLTPASARSRIAELAADLAARHRAPRPAPRRPQTRADGQPHSRASSGKSGASEVPR